MLNEGTRRFDLYDFFSVLLPGVAFVIGLLPFLPHGISVSATAVIGFLLVWGFVFGRALHVIGVAVDQFEGWWIIKGSFSIGHRDKFVEEVLVPNRINTELANGFYLACRRAFPQLDLPSKREKLDRSDNKNDIEMLYGLTRSYIHMDGRGRSRTFQAVLDFYRTMMVVSLALIGVYVLYAIVSGAAEIGNHSLGGLVYRSYLGTVGPSPGISAFISICVFLPLFFAFHMARSPYRIYYVQYLLSDFIILQNDRRNE